MNTRPHLSIILPAYNEERRLGRCLDALFGFLPRQRYTWEIIAVNDGSTDGTWSIMRGYAGTFNHFYPLHAEHAGKGNAVRLGMLTARGNYRMFMDVDLSTPLTEIPNALAAIGDAEIVIGSREVNREKVRETWKRRIMGRLFHALIADIVPGIRDTQCGFKLFRDYVADDIFRLQQIEGMAFDVELLYLALMKHYTVKEMPVEWAHDNDSRVRMFSTSWEMFVDVSSIPMRHKDLKIAKSTL
jgi:glycosyltransferase involved in cell wall biosynthesis